MIVGLFNLVFEGAFNLGQHIGIRDLFKVHVLAVSAIEDLCVSVLLTEVATVDTAALGVRG